MNKPKTVRRPTANAAWDYLQERVDAHNMAPLCRLVLENAEFCEAPASAGIHHCRESGLLEHTAEVVGLALDLADGMTNHMGSGCDRSVLVVAGVFHDFMKIRDYFWEVKEDQIAVGHKPYHKLVHHISGSFAAMMQQAGPITPAELGLASEKAKRHWLDAVGHAMLAHHGRLEFHSPVVPATSEALVLHQADYLSAHIDAKHRRSERWEKPDKASNT